MKSPLFIVITFFPTMTITIPVIADDDCIIAVNIIPNNSNNKGNCKCDKTSPKASFIDLSSQALDIIFNPTNIIPNPVIKFAYFFIFLIKANITPIKTSKDKYKEIFKLSKDAKRPVTVVPMFDPIIMAAA